MIYKNTFPYKPNDSEREKASNSYLMSLIALVVGLPFPIVNLVATLIFYLANRKGAYFVRWHATQALLSQLLLFFINSIGVWWTIYHLTNMESFNNYYLIYISLIIVLNMVEFVVTVYSSIQTRKGVHIEWFGYNRITNIFCKANIED